MIDLNQSTENKKKKSKRILIVEPESDIQYLILFLQNSMVFQYPMLG